jgi:hypothetical protein
MNKLLLALLLTSSIAYANKDIYHVAKGIGCDAAKADTGDPYSRNEKDIDRYVKEEYYRIGFDDGYKLCMAERDRFQRNIDDAVRRSVYGR